MRSMGGRSARTDETEELAIALHFHIEKVQMLDSGKH